MIVIGFFIFLLFLSALPLYVSVCKGYRPERLFLAGFLSNGLLLYGFAAFGWLKIGFYFLFAANMLLYVPAAVGMIRTPQTIRQFFTDPVICFYIAAAGCFLMALPRNFLFWDEFSHWGVTPKLLLESGLLNCAWSSLLEHASYVPGLAVLEVMVHHCFFGMPFQEPLVFFSVGIFMLLMILFPLREIGTARKFLAAGIVFFAPVVLMAVLYPGSFWSCESDCPQVLLFAVAVYAVLRHRHTWRDDFVLALLLGWLTLIKSAGFGFAMMTLIFYLIREICSFKRRDKFADKIFPCIVIAAPLLVKWSWVLQLKYWHTVIVFPIGGISAGGIRELILHGKPAYAAEVLRNFCIQGIGFFALFAAVMALLRQYCRKGENRPERCGDLLGFLPVSFGTFCIMLFLTYVFIFTEFQAHRMVSFQRYMFGFILMPILLTLFLIFSGGWSGRVRNRNLLVLMFCVFAFLFLCSFGYFLHRKYSGCEYPRRKDLQWVQCHHGKLLRQKGNAFHIVTADGAGQRSFMMRYAFPENFRKEINPRLEKLPETVYTERLLAPAELSQLFRQVRYVLIMRPHQDFLRDYREVFVKPPAKMETHLLYRVNPDGRLVDTVPEQ